MPITDTHAPISPAVQDAQAAAMRASAPISPDLVTLTLDVPVEDWTRPAA